MQVFQTPEAHADLLEIWVHIANDSFEAADQVLDQIGQKCEMIREFPHIGRLREDLSIGLRSITSGKYVICYRVKDDRVDVIRVLHGARNLTAIFQNSQE